LIKIEQETDRIDQPWIGIEQGQLWIGTQQGVSKGQKCAEGSLARRFVFKNLRGRENLQEIERTHLKRSAEAVLSSYGHLLKLKLLYIGVIKSSTAI
jgi:hypothetical protein